MKDTSTAIDPVVLEIIRGAVLACANEMAMVLRRTAYNPMIFEVQDYCVGVIDPQGQLIAQNAGGLPIFLADLGTAVADGIDKFGLDGFQPGDAIIMNAPYVCGQHLNNVVVYTPCFVAGELVAFPAVRAHWIDIGGRRLGFGSVETTEIYEEGLQLRSVKICREGIIDQDIWQIVSDNVRFPESSLGDLRGQIAACRLGEERLRELYEHHGVKTTQSCIRHMWDQSEKLARVAIGRIPDGRYRAESFLDNDGQDLDKRVPIKVAVQISGEEMIVDFSDVAPQVRGPINSGRSGGVAAARVAFKAVTLPCNPVDEGTFRPLKVILPPGRFISAEPPAALGQWSIPLPTVIDTVLAALAPAVPESIPAGHKGDMGGFSVHGTDPSNGRRYVCLNILGGGWGGRPHEDGPSAAVSVCQGDVNNTPIELLESRYPLIFDHFQLRTDSCGAGRFRGGLGIDLEVRSLHPAAVNFNLERTECPPWGLMGGTNGAIAEARVEQAPGASWASVKKATNYAITAESRVVFLTAGGGGLGDPLDRDPQAVATDVRQGYISIAAAAEYQVVIDPDSGELDMEATQELRALMNNAVVGSGARD